MSVSTVDPETLLAIDIGSVHTRAVLFDVVEGSYQVVAMGVAPSTVYAPWRDLREGVVRAIDQIQTITGRTLLDEEAQLIVPSLPEGSGVDQVAVTLSAGKPVTVIAVGALQGISLDSARRLAESTYTQIAHLFHLNDRLDVEQRLDLFVRAHPDLVILAGGTDGGAAHSVLNLVEAVGLGAYLLPAQRKPIVYYTGNADLVPKVKELLDPVTQVLIGPNVRPSLETERFLPAHEGLLEAFRAVRLRQMPELSELIQAAQGNVVPTATAFGRMIRYLSRLYGADKGVLGVDIGASATSLAAAWNGTLTLKVYSALGLGESLEHLLRHTSVDQIVRWLATSVTEDDIVDYLYTKVTFPDSVPVTDEELQIEQALARQILRVALKQAYPDFPRTVWQTGWLLPAFEPILLSGSTFTRAGHPAHAVAIVLDGLQPTGVTTLVLDQNHLLALLGAAAVVNPYLGVQVLESPHFVPLATVIAPVWHGRFGTRILTVTVERTSGEATKVELRAGTIEKIPLPVGQQAKLTLHPHAGADVGKGPGRRLTVQVAGSQLGLILDGRGRPLRLPSDPERRQQLHQRWLWALKG